MFKIDKYGGKWNVFKVFGLGMDKLLTVSKSRPCMYNMIFMNSSGSITDIYFWCKIIFGFIFGILANFLFYELILVGFPFSKNTVFFLGSVSAIMLSCGCAFSSKVRCIAILTIPSYTGKAGRQIIISLLISSLLLGPVRNIMHNIEEIVRMNTCSNALAANLSKARSDLLVKPFKNAFLGTKVNNDEMKDMLGSVNNVIEPIAQEIEGEDDVKFIQEENDYLDERLNDTKRSEELNKKYNFRVNQKRNDNSSNLYFSGGVIDKGEASKQQQKYFKKLETRCENIKTGMTDQCRKRFSKVYDNCIDTVFVLVNYIVCLPMKLDMVCDVIKVFSYGGYNCDPSNHVSNGIGQGYVSLLNSGKTMKANVTDERMQFKLHNPPNYPNIHDTYTRTESFKHLMKAQKNVLDWYISIVKTVLAFVFILVIISATKYNSSFLTYIDFDNFYITSDFRVLDARRHLHKLQTLLPLTKLEKNWLADPYSLKLSPIESSAWQTEFWKILFVFLLCVLLLLIDYLFCYSLDWIRNNLKYSFKQSGYNSFKIEVLGVGFVANIVRSMMKGFDFKREMKKEVTNDECLPKAKYLSRSELKNIYFKLACLFLMAYFEGYVKRTRRAICAFYYREQEKRRIEALYKKTLAYRNSLFEERIEGMFKQAKKVEIKSDLRLMYRLQMRFPACTFLRLLPGSRPVCVMCKQEEPCFERFGPRHYKCNNCDSFYCLECWNNFDFTCFLCVSYKIIKNKIAKHGVLHRPIGENDNKEVNISI